MNVFGGDWTKIKIEILVEYAQAYLRIMSKRPYYKLLYFDGFAGSGSIIKEKAEGVEETIGAARRIVEISDPIPFDLYYFVEKNPKNFVLLEESTKKRFPDKTIYTVNEDCNDKMVELANFLRRPENKKFRTLAYIDPCGMQVEWRSIECLRGLPVDMWVLVPTGLGVNRLLKKDGEITASWMDRLERFLGKSKEDIKAIFYQESQTLFPGMLDVRKKEGAIKRSTELYKARLNEVFQYVSEPYELTNSTGSIMYHLFLAANNKTAVKIGNDIVKKYMKE